jgi:uncharacterized protein (TIGR03067 family)
MNAKRLFTVIVFCLVVSSSSGQEKAGATDKDKLQGKWSVVSAKGNGQDLPADLARSVKIAFEGDKYAVTIFDQKITGTFKVDPTKKPKELDINTADGKIAKAIYELNGDTLKIAEGEAGDARPKEFLSKEGNNITVMVLKLEK